MRKQMLNLIAAYYYDLYYGALGRNIFEICADNMSACIRYYSPLCISTRLLDLTVCAVFIENTYKLTC